MDKNRVLGARFLGYVKYLRRIALGAFVLYIPLVALSTGQGEMVLICYILLMVAVVAALQSVVLSVLARYYMSKAKEK